MESEGPLGLQNLREKILLGSYEHRFLKLLQNGFAIAFTVDA